jgi:hypothetical protein
MQLISCQHGKLFTATHEEQASAEKAFVTGFDRLDQLAPRERWMRGAIHELLVQPESELPSFPAMLLARAAVAPKRAIIWCDSTGELYPPAVAPFIQLENLYLLQPQTLSAQSWTIAECLRCKAVAAVIAAPSALSRIEARRLQLAAERGGGVGILLRYFDRGASVYAASTRWLVSPCPGEPDIQKWKIQLIHGHGGRVGQAVILEHHRETHLVCATEELVDRSLPPKAIRVSA